MKRSNIPDDCSRMQKDLILGDDLSQKTALRKHLQICPRCRAFFNFQVSVKQGLMADRYNWRPRAKTLAHVHQYLICRQGKRNNSPVYWLEQVLAYRIPVYQALVVIMLAGFVYWGATHLHSSITNQSSPPVGNVVDETIIETVQATQLLQSIHEQKIGRTINDDSLYNRFTFTL